MSKTPRKMVVCHDCEFNATGAEAYVVRKGSIHAKKHGHRVGYGEVDDGE